jgi:phosphoribosyl 1,2-cyclic phosphate phosphodiesterase
VVIDTGPEFRIQALRAGITGLDAVLLTHAHADHLHGLDDLRPLSWKKPIPVYGNEFTIGEMRERFSYVFRKTQRGGGKPRILPVIARKPLKIGGLALIPIPVKHGVLDILGWMIREAPRTGASPEDSPPPAAVYLTDTSSIPSPSLALIDRPDLLIVGALRKEPHETHFSFDQALNAAVGTGAPRIYLTHISHQHSHREIEDHGRLFRETHGLEAALMGPSWDGLDLDL